MSAEQWRWTDDEGVQRLLLGDDLRTALRQGRLKPSTLVWRRGMKNWVPASEVPELAAELGAAAIKPATGGEIGRVAPPTASIPPPIGDARARAASGRPMPSNMVDIGALRARTGSEPARPDPDAQGAQDPGAVAIPRAPRVPAAPATGSAPTGGTPAVRGHKPRTTSVDGLWSKPDVESTSTTTMVRDGKGGVGVAGPRPRGSAAEGARAAPTWPRGRAIDNPPTADTETQPKAADRGGPPGRAGAGSAAPKATAPMPLSRSVTKAPPPPSHAPPARPPAAPAPTTEGGAKRTVPPPPPVRKGATATPAAKATPAAEPKTATPKKVVDFARTLAGGIRPVPGAQPRRPTEPLLEWGALVDSVVGAKPAADDARAEGSSEAKPTTGAQPAAAPAAGTGAAAGASPQKPDAPAAAPGPAGTDRPAPDAAPGPVFAGAAATASAPWLAAKAARDLGDEPSFTAPLPLAFTPTPSDVGAMLGAQASTPAPTHGAGAPPAAPGAAPPASADAPPAATAVTSAAAGAPKPASRAPAPVSAAGPSSSVPVSSRMGRAADLGHGGAGVPEPTPSRAALSLRSIRLPKWAPAAAGAAALVLGTTAFALGRCSAPDETPVAYARSGLASLLLLARGAPSEAAPTAARPCLMIRAPARWAPSATTRVSTEITASSSGLFAVGFARGDKQAGGLTISPATGVVEDVFKPAASEDDVARVVPYEDGGKLVFGVSLVKQGALANGVQVAASPPLLLGFTEAAVASVPVIGGEPHGDPVSLWLLDRSSGT
ncbi:MAG: DUF4339 domain-containing protein, partial [Polyangiaceae bacterium]|nr:DUF4339 domain-containing protein [Polyangiaceae bacterium]